MNPVLSQASFDLISERFCYLLKKYMVLRETRYRFEQGNVRVVREGTALAGTMALSNMSLAGVNLSKPGLNTDNDGKLFLRVTDETPGAGQSRWQLFKATGGGAGNEVARADVADSATGTWTAQNSSGMSGGTITVGVVTASLATDVTWFRCYVDFPVFDKQVFNDAVLEDAAQRARIQATNASIVTNLKGAESLALSDWSNLLVNYVATYILSGATVPISKKFKNDAGAISLQSAGVLEDLNQAMAGNTTIQYVVKNTVSVAAAVFDSANVGKGSITSPTYYDKVIPGTILLQCVDETIGREEFTVVNRRTDNNTLITALNRLRVKKEYKDPNIGVKSLTLMRTFTKTGDNTHIQLAIDSDASWSTAGESKSNTTGGLLYWQTRLNSGVLWDIEFYSTNSYQSGDLVAKATAVAVSTTFQAIDQNGSGLVINGKTGSAPTTLAQGTFNLNPFKAGPPYDKISMIVTRTTTGEIQKLLAELVDSQLDWYLSSAASGAETWPEYHLTRGGTPLYGKN